MARGGISLHAPRGRVVACAVWLALCGAPSACLAQALPGLAGVVHERDAANTPVVGATVDVVEASRTTRTDPDGRFRFDDIAAGTYTLRVRRLGYEPVTRNVHVAGDSVHRIAVALVPGSLALGAVVVTGLAGERDRLTSFQPVATLDGAPLDRILTSSIAASVASEPGITQRYNGPMATQPVIRGLSGDRVVVLEDGLRTGDIATTAADHAVTIDPMSARRIEIVRGPAGLVYGSSTLGGVVNVVREDVPRALPERHGYTLGGMTESVNHGMAASATADVRIAPHVAARAGVVTRSAGDSRTPRGMLPFTDVRAHERSLGASWITGGSYIGGAVREYHSTYGVPSSFGGVTLPGAHAGGVYIDARRTTGRLEGEWKRGPAIVRSLSGHANAVRFEQSELERGGFVGTRFGQLAASGGVTTRLAAGRHAGVIGASGEWRDFRAEGSYTGTRPAVQKSAAAFGFDEIDLGSLRLLAGLRLDRSVTTPLDSSETRVLRGVRTRAFDAVSGSLASTYTLAHGIVLGASVARAFRGPAIEELYSAGPHLAGYAYEVGNPDLRPEMGHGVDAFVRVERTGLVTELGVFRNDVRDFIRYAPVIDSATGSPVRDPRLRRYVVYRPTQDAVRLHGLEAKLAWEVTPAIALDAMLSAVTGTRRGDVPLADMPPVHGRFTVRHETPRASFGASLAADASQTRVPAPALPTDVGCEGATPDGERLPAEYCPTRGFVLVGAHAGRRWSVGQHVVAATLVLDNAFDTVWRDHLWRAKQVAIQPGRNVRLVLRVSR